MSATTYRAGSEPWHIRLLQPPGPRSGVNWLPAAYFVAGAFIVLFLVVPLATIVLETLGLMARSGDVPADLYCIHAAHHVEFAAVGLVDDRVFLGH